MTTFDQHVPSPEVTVPGPQTFAQSRCLHCCFASRCGQEASFRTRKPVYGKRLHLQKHGNEGLDLQDLSALLHEQVVKLEAQLQELAALERSMRARHRHNLGLLGHQVVDAICLALRAASAQGLELCQQECIAS